MTDPLDQRVLALSQPAFFTLSTRGVLTRWSPGAEALYGYSEADVLDRTPDFLTIPGQPTSRALQFAELPNREWVECHRQKDGTEFFVALRFETLDEERLVCVRDVNAERQARDHLAASRDALNAGRNELRQLAGRLLEAQETERRHIARELHDDFKQRLGALGFRLAALAERCRQSTQEIPSPSLEDLEALVLQVEELGTDIRRISHRLHPAALERLGLVAALETHAATVETSSELTVQVQPVANLPELPLETSLGLYRIAQEALNNAVRHSEARRVEVNLRCEPHALRLLVTDDGIGFDTHATSSGLGMESLRERAHLLNGTIHWTTSPGAGTQLEVTVPLTTLPQGSASPPGNDASSDTPQQLGAYELLEILHESPKTTVYLAQEPPPLGRQVAIKLHRKPLAGRRETLSFKAERQALAKLRHPNIGQIYEARTNEDGDPYIVMEYVPGLAITHYCDRYRLNLRQRIELFLEVCEGVAYVHQKGVVHRDLAPANVLVMEEDGHPTPKLVAFGIAKGLDQPLAEGTVWTQDVIDSPIYVSPEVFGGQEADTRSDVYALGVMLYELLSGVLPANNEAQLLKQWAGGGHPPPSRLLETQDASLLETAAQARNIPSRHLTPALRGDLDWILVKTLAPEPAARYAGAAALAEDLRRHLRAEPVLAGPGTWGYRLNRLAYRHRTGLAVALALLAVAIGIFSVF